MASIAPKDRASTHPTWHFPYRKHETYPTGVFGHAANNEWVVEQLIAEYVESDSERTFDVLHNFRRDLTHAELFEAVELLCMLSEAVADVRDNLSGNWPQYEALVGEYASELARLATLPGRDS